MNRPPFLPRSYKLAWRDEFDGDSIDTAKWAPWLHGIRGGSLTVEDAAMLDRTGHLLVTTRRTQTGYTSGGLTTKGLYEFGPGAYIEASLMMPVCRGHWGAFWCSSATVGSRLGDPSCGVEIDVMESMVEGGVQCLNWDGYAESARHAEFRPGVVDARAKFHTWGCWWSSEGYRFYVDGRETWAPKDAPVSTCQRQFLLLTCEVPATPQLLRTERLPDSMVVDWVRVWR